MVLLIHAPIAQLDRVFGFEPKGWGFNPLWVYQEHKPNKAFFCVKIWLVSTLIDKLKLYVYNGIY